jgi:hypothetical protein
MRNSKRKRKNMNVNEYFDFKKYLSINNDVTETHSVVDTTGITDDEMKLEKAVKSFLAFLLHSGFDGESIYDAMIESTKIVTNHPDMEDFALKSAIEEQVNNSEDFRKFVKHMQETEDMEFLKEVYRSWVMTHTQVKVESD